MYITDLQPIWDSIQGALPYLELIEIGLMRVYRPQFT